MSEVSQPDNRKGNTRKELQEFMDGFSEDTTLDQVRDILDQILSQWEFDGDSEEALRKIYTSMFELDRSMSVSEVALAALRKAGMLWFGYEAGISREVEERIYESVRESF